VTAAPQDLHAPQESAQHPPAIHPPTSDWIDSPDEDSTRRALSTPHVALIIERREHHAALSQLNKDLFSKICKNIDEHEITRRLLTHEVHAEHPDVIALTSRLPPGPHIAALREDIASLTRRFGAISGDDALHVGLGLTRQDECKRFHVDSMRLRLLCTYLGPGTQWLPARAANLYALGSPHHQAHHVIADPDAIQQADSLALVWMKGNRFATDQLGAIHRSPPIQHLGLARLILRISTPDAPFYI
jgi:hypothetical protein